MRRAGTGRTPAGDLVTWTVAEGRRGRRWREAVAPGPGLRHSLLLETDPDGRFSHLELATRAGLLTLHPEGDGTIHGNVVDERGVRHVVGLAWEVDGCVVIEGSPIATAAAVSGLGASLGPGGSAARIVLHVTRGLELRAGPGRVERLDAATWRIDGAEAVRVDGHGLPVLADARTWPLELGTAG